MCTIDSIARYHAPVAWSSLFENLVAIFSPVPARTGSWLLPFALPALPQGKRQHFSRVSLRTDAPEIYVTGLPIRSLKNLKREAQPPRYCMARRPPSFPFVSFCLSLD